MRKNYRMVLYHNWRHAFNVCQLMFAMLTVSVFSDGGSSFVIMRPYGPSSHFCVCDKLPFKIILASPALKKPCLTSSFPNTFTELHSPCVPPCNPLFALITSYHNYCFMCSSSHKTGEPLRTRILPVSVFPVAWNKKKQKQAMFIE